MITMDFGILLQAIGHMAICLFLTGLLAGWVIFVNRMIENLLTCFFVAILPVLTIFTILEYHMLANS